MHSVLFQKWSNSLAREAREEAEQCYSFKRRDPNQLGSEIRDISFKYENPVFEWRKRNNDYKFGILTKTTRLRHGSYTQRTYRRCQCLTIGVFEALVSFGGSIVLAIRFCWNIVLAMLRYARSSLDEATLSR
ncbi:hypothetical protein T265_08373 [Opisthorchis viverrini]|uniref:Uncharacterized protein n=1 Tax=Opisthorchis viverrini TaxID=6198 RepID=A0A074Z9N5_OPIVI|nr:hypothetical protein T265_08373 [Opisthorchis viverrini]KER23828.1 hypothetical protein T265_08373 [Opisthorchis viverrini]